MGDETLVELRQRAQASYQRLCDAGKKLSKRSLEIGWEVAFLREYELWPFIGFDSEKAAMLASGVSRSTWYQCARIAEFFPKLEREQFLSFSIENAQMLSTQPEEVRYSRAMIDNAATLTKSQMEHELVMDTARRENRPPGEVRVALKWRMSQSQRQVILSKLREWQKSHGIDDEAYALELLMVEVTDHATLVGFIQESIIRLSRVVMTAQSATDFDSLRELFAAHIQEMGEILRICCQPEMESAA